MTSSIGGVPRCDQCHTRSMVYHRKDRNRFPNPYRCRKCGHEWGAPPPPTPEQIKARQESDRKWREQRDKEQEQRDKEREQRRKEEIAEKERREKEKVAERERLERERIAKEQERKRLRFESEKSGWATWERKNYVNGEIEYSWLKEIRDKQHRKYADYVRWKREHGITGFLDRDFEKNRLEQEERERKRLVAENTCSVTRLLKKDCEDCREGLPHRNWY